ncbi:hypothetical protein M514_08609 [Trichuris suis]|uniref:Uncharacterized protein n=1 Tax=Trichuris suis TaxID=68888 RepID=A0A085N1T1_9BILA|nr:hypothetical protein M513_08609 [Trichuris suis]KFD63427.1 hypothetical protein M514_08609 [Trichuris suis]
MEAGPSRAAYRAMQFTLTEPPATYETCAAGHLLKNRPVSDCRQKTCIMGEAPSDEDPEAGQCALRRSSRLRKAHALHCCDS